MDANVDIGRMGENIVTNELLSRGFLVTHLDKGTRGVSANADLLVGHPQLSRPVLIQVKASYGNPPNVVFLGGLTASMLEGHEPVYNRKPGFKADYVVAATIQSPRIYRTFVLPVAAAEDLVLRMMRDFHALPTRAGAQRKVVPTVYVSVVPMTDRAAPLNRAIQEAATETLLTFEDRYETILG